MQALLHCPNVLVCVGREPFKPVSMENLRKHSVEKLPDLTPRSNGNNVNENNESKKNSGGALHSHLQACVLQLGDYGHLLYYPRVQISCVLLHLRNALPSLPPRHFHPLLLFLWFPSRISSLHPLVFLLHAPHVWLTSLPLSYLCVSFSFQNSLLSCVCLWDSPNPWDFPRIFCLLVCCSYNASTSAPGSEDALYLFAEDSVSQTLLHSF